MKLFSSKRRISFALGAVMFFSTLLFYFYAMPSKGTSSLSDRRSKTALTSTATAHASSTSEHTPDYSALSSKLKSGKNDSQVLLIVLLLIGAGFMIYSVVKKEDTTK